MMQAGWQPHTGRENIIGLKILIFKTAGLDPELDSGRQYGKKLLISNRIIIFTF